MSLRGKDESLRGLRVAERTPEERERRRFLLLLLGGCFATPLLLRQFRLRARGGSSPLTPEAQRGLPQEMTFARTGATGGRWSLADERGKVVVLNLWATWCVFCREEMPLLVEVSRSDGVSVAGLSLETVADRSERIAAFARRYAVEYPLLLPDAGSTQFAEVRALPTTLLFDRKGRLAKVVTGELQEGSLRADLRQLQAETG